ncbi:ankyrin, partial [Choiromyces venosus 120613-1]
DARDSMGRTPLFIAAGDNLMAVQCLLAHGADVNTVNTARQTPLMKASKYDASDIIRILLTDESIDVNKQDCHGRTALYLAASRGQVNATAALLADSRIDVNIESQKRFVPWVLSTPLKIAWKNGHKEIVKMFLERSDVADR